LYQEASRAGRPPTSFAGNEAGTKAVRVSFISLTGYAYAEGRTMWVQQPTLTTEASGSAGPTPPPQFWSAELGCAPYYTDWSVYDRVDVYGAGVVPNSLYEVQFISDDCQPTNEEHYSPALVVHTSRAGDIVGTSCAPAPCNAPQGVIDFTDISACVDKFRNLPTAPRKARADVINSTVSQPKPDLKIDFVDISCIVDSFRGSPCALPGPAVVDPCAR